MFRVRLLDVLCRGTAGGRGVAIEAEAGKPSLPIAGATRKGSLLYCIGLLISFLFTHFGVSSEVVGSRWAGGVAKFSDHNPASSSVADAFFHGILKKAAATFLHA